MKTTLIIKGTHCASCKALIEDVCGEIEGIRSCVVDFKTGATEIEYDENVDWKKFKKKIEGVNDYRVEINQ